MNIAFDCERMKYPYTGLFEYCHQLGLALKKASTNEDTIKYYLRDGDQRYFDANDEFLIRNVWHKFVFPNYSRTDLWHITHQTSVYVPKSTRIKKVLTIHDLNFLYEKKSAAKQKKYLENHQRNIDISDHIVAISNYTKDDITKHLKTGDKPVTVIYNGCAEEDFSACIKPVYQPSAPFLLGIGTVNAKKNFHVLIPLLKGNDFELILAGRIDKGYHHKIMEEAAKYDVIRRVKVIGPVSGQDKSWYLKNCEAFLFPSLAEGFGIPPIEAMRFGKPTFLSNSTSLPEVGGKSAYYFDNYDPDHMIYIFEQGMKDYQARQPADEIIRHASQFSWKNSAEAYWKIYKDTLRG